MSETFVKIKPTDPLILGQQKKQISFFKVEKEKCECNSKREGKRERVSEREREIGSEDIN
jgi:hypothetical protein